MAAKKIDAVFTLKDAFSPKMFKIIQSMESGGAEVKRLSRDFQRLGKKIESVGSSMKTNVTTPILAAGAATIAAADQVDQGEDAITRATGATGKTLQNFFQIQKNVASGVQASYESIGGALGEVNTRFGFTGGELENCTTQFMRFAEATGMDATEAVQLASRAMGDAGVPAEDYAGVLDMVAKASQVSGISQSSLFENMTKYGAPMRALGFEMEESMALFSGWEKAGVTTEIAFSGMKKAISNWAKEGKDPREEFKKTLAEIKSTPDIASATTKAIEIFGAKAGPDLADAIRGGRFEYEDMLTAIEGSKGTVDSTWGAMQDGVSRLKMAMNNLMGSSVGFRDIIMDMAAGALTKIADKVKMLTDWFSKLSDGQKEFVVKAALVVAATGPAISVFGKFTGAVGKNIKTIKTMVSTAKKIHGGFSKGISAVLNFSKALKVNIMWQKMIFGAKLKAASNAAFSVIVKGAKKAGAAMKVFGKFLLSNPWILVIAGIATAAFLIYKNWSKIKPFFANLWTGVTTTFQNAINWVRTNCPALYEIISTQIANIKAIFAGVKTFLGGIIDFVKGVFTGNWKLAWEGVKQIFSGVFQTFSGIAKAPINAVISLVNSAIKSLNKIKVSIPDWVPIWGGKEYKINIPTIPKLYKGTNYWQGGAAMVNDRGGEIIDLPRGSRVYPHDKSVSMARDERSGVGGLVITIPKLADQIIVREDADIEKIATAATEKIIKEVNKSRINKGNLGVNM